MKSSIEPMICLVALGPIDPKKFLCWQTKFSSRAFVKCKFVSIESCEDSLLDAYWTIAWRVPEFTNLSVI